MMASALPVAKRNESISDHRHYPTADQTDRRPSFSIVLDGLIVVAEIIGGVLSGSIATNKTNRKYKMKIQILGTGCAKCKQLTEAATAAADELGLDYEIEKITDMMRFADFGVMMTPALAVDGTVKVAGKVPTHKELKTMLQ